MIDLDQPGHMTYRKLIIDCEELEDFSISESPKRKEF
jgi:hypothetical protein